MPIYAILRALLFFAPALSFSMKNFKNGFPGHHEDFFLDALYEEILFREKEAQVSKGFFSEPHYFLGTKLSQVWSS